MLIKGNPVAGEVNDWRRFLATQDDDATLDAIRLHGRTGRPLGDVRFLQRLQRRLSRRLIPGNPGCAPKRRELILCAESPRNTLSPEYVSQVATKMSRT